MKTNYPLTQLTYESQDLSLEGLIMKPEGDGPFATIVMIHGFNRVGAWDYVFLGSELVKTGYAVFLPSQIGFGNSKGERDYCGPKTVQSIFDGVQELLKEKFVDSSRLAIWGFSRGSNVASSFICKFPQIFKVAVLQSGMYDFRKVLETTSDLMMRDNMIKESGNTEEAFDERSAIKHIQDSTCPLLILHGQKDSTYTVDQVLDFEKRLIELGKNYELHIMPDGEHAPMPSTRKEFIFPFLDKYLSQI